jgi:hypothetical protein
MSELESALERSRELINAALTEARRELAALDARKAELEALIAQGEAALRGAQAPAIQDAALTLHDALQRILRENGNRPMPVRQLADEVNQRGLYRTRDGAPVEVSQVHARTSNYDKVFGKAGSLVWLKEEPGVIVPFKDDSRGFLSWITGNPDGYLINADRNPKPSYLVLHRSGCGHFRGEADLNWTKDYIKFCSRDSGELEDWAASSVGGKVTRCPSCMR